MTVDFLDAYRIAHLDDAPTEESKSIALARIRHRAELIALYDALEHVRANLYLFEHNEPDAADTLVLWAESRNIEVVPGSTTDGATTWLRIETKTGFGVTVYRNVLP